MFFLFEWCVFATLLEIPQLQPHLKIGTCPSQGFNKSNSSVNIIVSIIVGCCARVAASGGGCTVQAQVHLNSVSFPRCLCLGCKLHKQIGQIV